MESDADEPPRFKLRARGLVPSEILHNVATNSVNLNEVS
jgi:hypothetical protein